MLLVSATRDELAQILEFKEINKVVRPEGRRVAGQAPNTHCSKVQPLSRPLTFDATRAWRVQEGASSTVRSFVTARGRGWSAQVVPPPGQQQVVAAVQKCPLFGSTVAHSSFGNKSFTAPRGKVVVVMAHMGGLPNAERSFGGGGASMSTQSPHARLPGSFAQFVGFVLHTDVEPEPRRQGGITQDASSHFSST